MPAKSQDFSASYDSATKIISAIACIVLIVLAAAINTPIPAIIGVLVIAIAYAYSPRGYSIQNGAIVVKRLIGNTNIPLDGLRAIRACTKDDFSGCVKLCGSGGLFGHYGLYRTSKLGACSWYMTNRRNAVVAIAERKTAVFSPDDVDGFITAIKATAPALENSAGSLAPDLPQARPSGLGLKWIPIAIGLIVAAIIPLALMYSPGPPSYTLTPSTLVIHDRFYPVTLDRAGVDRQGIRVVDIATDPNWRPTARTNGFANSHYRSGWFRVAIGQKVRMYWTTSTQLVLFPPKGEGTPVLLEVAQPEQFIVEVRREWGQW